MTTNIQLSDKDYISLVAFATNGSKKDRIEAAFNGLGQQIDRHGQVLEGKPGLQLKNGLTVTAAPKFPEQDFRDALADGDAERAQAISDAFSEAVAAITSKGKSVTLQSSVLDALCNFMDAHGWSQEDKGASVPVYNRSDFGLTEKELDNGARVMFFTQQAVFGA